MKSLLRAMLLEEVAGSRGAESGRLRVIVSLGPKMFLVPKLMAI